MGINLQNGYNMPNLMTPRLSLEDAEFLSVTSAMAMHINNFCEF